MGVYVYQNEQLDKVAGLGYSVVDSAISSSSENPVQNKVVKEYVDTKVSKDQGVAQSGKVLGINASGMVEPVDVAGSASDITYDNSTSGLTATDVQEAVDEIDSTVDGLGSQVSTLISDTANYYNITDSADTTLVDADSIPFYDTSASAKKKITWANIVTKIKSSLANYFGRKFSQSNGKLSLLAEDNTSLNTVTLQPLATNTSYSNNVGLGVTNVQSAIDKLGNFTYGNLTINSSYATGNVFYQKFGRVVTVFLADIVFTAQPPEGAWSVPFVSGLPKAATLSSNPKIVLYGHNNTYVIPVRLAFGTGSTELYFHWNVTSGISTSANYNATFSYICE